MTPKNWYCYWYTYLSFVKSCFVFFFQLFGSILESFRKQFALGSDVHIILFPHLLYPFTQIAITASIFMTVAIALERFIAVHYPINYRWVLFRKFYSHLFYFMLLCKGQLNSKCPFGVIACTKIPTKKFDKFLP